MKAHSEDFFSLQKSFSRSLQRKILPCFFRLRKKPMDVNQEIIVMSSQIGSVYEFGSFVTTFYDLTNWTYPQCNIRSFNNKVVVESSRSYENARNFCMWTCIQNPELFKSIYAVYIKKVNTEEIASFLPLISIENYPIDKCICKICLFIFQNWFSFCYLYFFIIEI